ncbi:hypothetical protein PoB_001014700 [Plakobranchus ocellatus]|uniref:Uncharacterized protein n=1 Tax=Plakobranchus ocellatus TaxID=259542 RepID=A0AAV3YL54_9GAST|nr:hypothetical protein PoB_001014700 [Plakobranchus ocellatus]
MSSSYPFSTGRAASGAFNPRSPPNVVPTASLVQMTPGMSLRSFATQGGHGLPPAYPYQPGPSAQHTYHHQQHHHHHHQHQHQHGLSPPTAPASLPQQGGAPLPPPLKHLPVSSPSTPESPSPSGASSDLPSCSLTQPSFLGTPPYSGSGLPSPHSPSSVRLPMGEHLRMRPGLPHHHHNHHPLYPHHPGVPGALVNAGHGPSSPVHPGVGPTSPFHFAGSPRMGHPPSATFEPCPNDCDPAARYPGHNLHAGHAQQTHDGTYPLRHMFSPPVRGAGGAAPVKNGQPEPGGMYTHGYKPQGMSEGNMWSSNQSPSGFEGGRYEDHRHQFNGTGPDHVEHFLGPGPEDKGEMYRAGYPGRDGLPPTGMLGNAMSPDAMSAGKTTCNSYFPHNKRQLDDSPRGVYRPCCVLV